MTVAKLVESEEYKIAEVVFSKSEFNKEDIHEELIQKGFRLTIDDVFEILENYRDGGLIAKIGRSYALNL